MENEAPGCDNKNWKGLILDTKIRGNRDERIRVLSADHHSVFAGRFGVDPSFGTRHEKRFHGIRQPLPVGSGGQIAP